MIGDQLGWWSKRTPTWRSPVPKKASRVHLHVVQRSLKTIWKPAEGLLYTQGGRKIQRWSRRKGRKVMHRQTLTLGDEQPEPWIGHSVLDLHKGDEPRPWLVGGQRNDRKALGSLDIYAEHGTLARLEAVWTEVSSRDCWVSCEVLYICSHPNQVNTLNCSLKPQQWICQGHHPREGLTWD